MRVNIKRTRLDGEVGMRQMLVKAFTFNGDEVKYFVVRAKSDDAAFHKVRKYLKEDKSVDNASAFWYMVIRENPDKCAIDYLKAVRLN